MTRWAKRVILRCGNTAALNGSILVVSNLRHDLSGMAIIEHLRVVFVISAMSAAGPLLPTPDIR